MGLIQNKVKVSQPNSHVVVKNAGGLRGLTGEQGIQGPQGVPGQAATVTAGTTTTLPAGSNATVQNVGSTSAAIFNFGIPQGEKGDTGETGAAATISVGTTTTLDPGEDATVTNSGTSSAAVFDFGIPKGAKGDTGSQGLPGQDGADGFSPTATVSKTGDTATITITDKDGTTTAQISDGVTPTIDSALSPTSENPVQNKVVTNALAGKTDKPIVISSLPATGTEGQEYFVDDRYNTVTELKGDTEQTTYSGKNLLNQPSSWSFTRWTNFQPLSPGTYYVSCGAVTKGGSNDPQIGDSAAHISITSNMLNKVLNFTGTALTVYSNGWSWGDSSVTSTVENLIITTSPISSIADYEPYVGGTASPNPDYPQEVKTVTGEQTVTISDGQGGSQDYSINLGKNLLDNYNPTVVSANTAWTPTANGGLYTATSGWTGGVQWKLIVETGATYQFQYKERTDQNLYLYITTYTDSTYTTVKTMVVNDGRYTKYPIVPDSPYLEIKFNNSAAITDVAVEELMFEKAATRTTYAPYFTPIELCKIGDYQDYIYKSGEDWYVHKEIGIHTFSDSDNWRMPNSSSYPHLFQADNISSLNLASTYTSSSLGVGALCYALTFRNSTDVRANEGFALYYSNTSQVARICNNSLSSMTDLSNWLSDGNVKAYYALATPTDTQITNSALIAQLEALAGAKIMVDGGTATVTSQYLPAALTTEYNSNSGYIDYIYDGTNFVKVR